MSANLKINFYLIRVSELEGSEDRPAEAVLEIGQLLCLGRATAPGPNDRLMSRQMSNVNHG